MLKSDCVIAGSNFIFKHISENYPEHVPKMKKFLVIFRGINTEYYDPNNINKKERTKLFAKLNIESGKKIILMPGRLTEWKGQELLIESLSILKTNFGYKNFVAIILGSDQGRDTYKKKLVRLVEQHRLNNSVIFVDHLELMPIAYEISDLVVSSSVEPEAFGRVSVEAQSMEKPIIASNIGGSKETVINEKSGFLFDTNNAKSLTEQILKVLNMEETHLKMIGNEGRKNVTQRFNVEKMCFSTYSEYKRLLN